MGVKDTLIACVDGLKGFPEVIEFVKIGRLRVQTCIVHLWLSLPELMVSLETTKSLVAADLRKIYQAASAAEADLQRWMRLRKSGIPARPPHWWATPAPALGTDHAVFCVSGRYPEGDLHDQRGRRRRKYVRRARSSNAGSFPNHEAALKLLYLALLNAAAKKWTDG